MQRKGVELAKLVKLVYLVELVFYSWLLVYTAMAHRTVLILLSHEGPLPGGATDTFASHGAIKASEFSRIYHRLPCGLVSNSFYEF